MKSPTISAITCLISILAVSATSAADEPNQCGGSIDRELANFAAAAADEMGRREVATDFQISSNGQKLELSAAGLAACAGGCPIVDAVLGLQRAESAMPEHDPAQLAATLIAGWNAQVAADAAAQALDAHELALIGDEPSECGAMVWYEAKRADCSGDCAISRRNG